MQCVIISCTNNDEYCPNSDGCDDKRIKIVVIGQTGVGKSTLVNGIVGDRVADVGSSLDAKTKKISCYNIRKNEVKLTICDTPGLQDGANRDDMYIKDIRETCENIDLIMFAIRMDASRFNRDSAWRLQNYENFDRSIWERVLEACNVCPNICKQSR